MMFPTKQMARISGFALALVILGFGGAVHTAELKPANVRMDFIIGGKHAPWFVALEKGFYTTRGLNVTIQSSTGSADTVRTIGSGAPTSVLLISRPRSSHARGERRFRR